MPNKLMGLDRVRRSAGHDLSRFRARSDTLWNESRTILERREHCAAQAFVKGNRWYADQQLEFQSFPNRRFACKALIQSSRRLIEESHHVILKSKNTLAFSLGRRLAN
jgi:hypothetical protein